MTPAPIMVETSDEMECRHCGAAMRLFGIEAHPSIRGADLQSYVCPRCDHVQTRAASAAGGSRGRPADGHAHDNAFDAETTRLLGATFDAAWEVVLATGDPPVEARSAAAVRESIARHIIELVGKGERNPQRLIVGSLRRLRRSPRAAIKLPAG